MSRKDNVVWDDIPLLVTDDSKALNIAGKTKREQRYYYKKLLESTSDIEKKKEIEKKIQSLGWNK